MIPKELNWNQPLVHPPVLVTGLQNILVVLNIPKIRENIWKSGWI